MPIFQFHLAEYFNTAGKLKKLRGVYDEKVRVETNVTVRNIRVKNTEGYILPYHLEANKLFTFYIERHRIGAFVESSVDVKQCRSQFISVHALLTPGSGQAQNP